MRRIAPTLTLVLAAPRRWLLQNRPRRRRRPRAPAAPPRRRPRPRRQPDDRATADGQAPLPAGGRALQRRQLHRRARRVRGRLSRCARRPAVLYNIGLTQKALFRYAEAIDSLQPLPHRGAEDLPPERRDAGRAADRRDEGAARRRHAHRRARGATVERRRARDRPGAAARALGVAAGNHVLEVTADGYKPRQARPAWSPPACRFAITIKLEVIPKTGKVHITASRPQALVRVDGQSYGFAPVDVELAGGGHQLEITAPKYMSYRERAGGDRRGSRAASTRRSRAPLATSTRSGTSGRRSRRWRPARRSGSASASRRAKGRSRARSTRARAR